MPTLIYSPQTAQLTKARPLHMSRLSTQVYRTIYFYDTTLWHAYTMPPTVMVGGIILAGWTEQSIRVVGTLFTSHVRQHRISKVLFWSPFRTTACQANFLVKSTSYRQTFHRLTTQGFVSLAFLPVLTYEWTQVLPTVATRNLPLSAGSDPMSVSTMDIPLFHRRSSSTHSILFVCMYGWHSSCYAWLHILCLF